MRNLIEDLDRHIEEARKDRPGKHGKMSGYNWTQIAEYLGGKLRNSDDPRSVSITVHTTTYRFTDNGGEINISKSTEVPVGESVPFWSNAHPGGSVGPLTLVYRLNAMIDGEPIDYDKDLDKE